MCLSLCPCAQEWSRRYEDTFFTAELNPAHTTVHPQLHCPLFELSVRAGENAWTLHRAAPEFDALAKSLAAELAAHKHAFVVPELPGKGWGGALGELLSSGGDSAEALAQKAAALNSWMHALLGGAARKICLFPSVRAFLDLDRQLIVKPQEADDDDDDEAEAAAAASAAQGAGASMGE